MEGRKLILMLFLFLLISSCQEEPCNVSSCKFVKGDDVKIKNKTLHDDATVVKVDCGCVYTVSYYSYLGVRRHRIVEEVELEKK